MNQEKFQKLYAHKQIKVIKLIEFLKEKPRPIHSMASLLEVDKVSVRNYIKTLRDLDVDVKQGELRKYYI
jgi:predicted transcriptional regulator